MEQAAAVGRRAGRGGAGENGPAVSATRFDPRNGGFGDAARSFPRPSELLFLLARARPRGARRSRSRWCSARLRRDGRSAGCAITSAAASTATRWMAAGGCPISRRCSTIRRSFAIAFVEAAQVSGDAFLCRGGGRHAALRHARDDGGGRRISTRPRMPTASPPEDVIAGDGPGRPLKKEGAFYLWAGRRTGHAAGGTMRQS